MAHAGGRPRSPGHRPDCPLGHAGTVHFDGFRRRRGDGLYARPVFRCIHTGNCTAACRDTCKGRHRFTAAEQVRTAAHPDGLWCRECDHERSPRDATPVGSGWEYEARLIADALVAVGAGASYRDAANRMRLAGRRYLHSAGEFQIASNAGETVHRYLDYFGELVLAHVEHRQWPEVLVLDALPLRKREALPDDPFTYEQSGNGAILVAYGYSDPLVRPRRRKKVGRDLVPQEPVKRRISHAWRIAIAGGVDRFSWLEFLSSLEGMPRWIVVDGDSAIRAAIALRWGTGPDAPVIFSCEGHMQRKFRERARDEDGLTGIQIWSLWPKHQRNDPNAVPGPLWSPDNYRALLDEILAYPPDRVRNISSWIVRHDRTIRRQFDLRARYPGMPRGSGAVEAGIVKLGAWLGARTRAFQNVRRLNITLGLMRANLGGHADASLYSRIIRDELARTGGRPKVVWRDFRLPRPARAGQPSPEGSLFRLADDAQATSDENRRHYWVSAKASSMAKKVEAMNEYHYLVGAPPLELTSARTPGVRVGSKMVSDFPKLLDEWDPANALDPYMTPAGSDTVVDWICGDVPTHRWSKSISARLIRLLGCPECNRVRGAAAEAGAATDPAVLRASLAAIRSGWGPYDGPRPKGVSESTPDPTWLADDEYANLEKKGLVAVAAEARPFGT